MTQLTSNQLWILSALIVFAWCILVGLLFHWAGGVLKKQDECGAGNDYQHDRDTQSNHEIDASDRYDKNGDE